MPIIALSALAVCIALAWWRYTGRDKNEADRRLRENERHDGRTHWLADDRPKNNPDVEDW